jgi:DNA polymerase III epsilon subunit-like protein
MVGPTLDGRTVPKVADWTNLTYVVVDVEGNGQQPPDLVELAAVKIVGGMVGQPVNWLVRPDQMIKHFASRIHGISNQDVADAPVFADIKGDVLRALEADAIVAHNAHVDLDVLRRKLGVWTPPEVFDTLKLARRLLPDHGSYKLGALVNALNLATGLHEDLTPHRATYDVLVTARLFVRLAGRTGSLELLRGDPPEGGEDETPALF